MSLPLPIHSTFTSHINSFRSPLASIIGSLAGTSYWGPVAGHGLLSHDLNLIRAERKRSQAERKGVVHGDTEALPAGELADHYVKITKHDQV